MIISFISFESLLLMFVNNLILNKKFDILEDYFSKIKNDLQQNIDNLNYYIKNEDYSIIENTNIDKLYDEIEILKENIESILLELDKNNSLYIIVDDILTLLNQFEDRLSTLESYKDLMNAD